VHLGLYICLTIFLVLLLPHHLLPMQLRIPVFALAPPLLSAM
jgi:hypothetical protein